MKTFNKVSLVILILISCSNIIGQDLTKPISKGTTPDSKYANIFVYLSTDRSYYLPGESVLFKAYFLDNLNNRSYPPNDTLHVALIDQDGIEAASGIFPVTNNLINGSIELPDFLTEGNYMLLASSLLTNNLSPEKMFSRVIEIRKSPESDLITDLSLKDTLYEPGSLLTAQIRFSGKDNKPIPASFNYQLTGKSSEILSGKSKASNEGMSTLTLKLPEFDNKEELKLLITPTFKGAKTITGIVIPTRFNNSDRKILPGNNKSMNDFKHLNIQLKTINLSNEKNDKVQLEISVTDDKGGPVMANLSVSASNTSPHQLSYGNDNIVSYINRKSTSSSANSNPDIRKYFAQSLLRITQTPGSQFIVQEKNNPKKLFRRMESGSQNKQEGYSIDRNIFDILMQIKPYHIENGKITFGISTMNSLNNLDGALIIVDGIKMGTDASILNTLPVVDIAHITASTNVMDIQRYSAMNNVGIIEITMKKSKAFTKNEEASGKTKSSTLFWGPDIMTDSSGKASASFFSNDNSTEVLISVEGIAANGLSGSSSLLYSVKR
jgi:hypothetical protein